MFVLASLHHEMCVVVVCALLPLQAKDAQPSAGFWRRKTSTIYYFWGCRPLPGGLGSGRNIIYYSWLSCFLRRGKLSIFFWWGPGRGWQKYSTLEYTVFRSFNILLLKWMSLLFATERGSIVFVGRVRGGQTCIILDYTSFSSCVFRRRKN